MRICWRCDLTGTPGLRSSVCPLPSRCPPAWRCQGGAPLAAGCAPCHPEWRQGASSWRRPDPLGAGGAPGACGGPGGAPRSPLGGGGRPPLHPLSTRSILAPIDGRFPAGEGRCCPAGQEKWLFAEPGAGSSIDLSVPRQRSIRPVISRAQSAAGAGRGAGKCQAGRGCPRARDARELPGSHFPLCTSTDLSLHQFPTAELGLRLFQPDWESGDCPGAVKASWQPRGWAHPPDGNVCLSIPSELFKERERAGQERGCPGG